MTTMPAQGPELTTIERATLAAAVTRILPPRRGVGAAEAGCPDYAVRSVERRFRGGLRQRMCRGLRFMQQMSEQLYGLPFSELSAEQQDGILLRVQQTPHPTLQDFFHRLVRLTLEGFLGHPRYGGNRGKVGWKHLGLCEADDAAGAQESPCTTR